MKLDWSLVPAFLSVAETGSLSAAAREIGTSQPTLGRQIKLAEAALGVTLFSRHARGLSLTPEGESLLPHARAMRDAAAQLRMTASGQDQLDSGTVRITAPKLVSHFLLPEIIAAIRSRHREIDIELAPTDSTENLLFREADIAVRMYRPTQADVVTRLIGHLPLGLYASQTYLQRHGKPRILAELASHAIVGYDRSELIIEGMAAFGAKMDRESFPVRCDDQAVYWQLVTAGCGIGVTQIAVGEREPRVTRLLSDTSLPELPVWLTAHQALRLTPRIRKVYDMLAEALSPFARA